MPRCFWTILSNPNSHKCFYSVCHHICFPSSGNSLSPNGFYSVYRRICFSEWHIVPQLCVQIKQSRVYSRKALAECKASRRLGKQIRGFSGFCLFLPCSRSLSVFIQSRLQIKRRMPKTLHLAHPPLPILIL